MSLKWRYLVRVKNDLVLLAELAKNINNSDDLKTKIYNILSHLDNQNTFEKDNKESFGGINRIEHLFNNR